MDNEVSETSFVIVLLKNIYILLHNVLFRHLHLASLLCKKQMNCELKQQRSLSSNITVNRVCLLFDNGETQDKNNDKVCHKQTMMNKISHDIINCIRCLFDPSKGNGHTSFLRKATKPYPLDFPEAVSFTTRQSLIKNIQRTRVE